MTKRIQAGMSEDEALARALQASMLQSDTTQPTSNIKKCAISWLDSQTFNWLLDAFYKIRCKLSQCIVIIKTVDNLIF